MKTYGWSWAELQATPAYVRRVAWDREQIQREVDNRKQG